MKRPYSLWSRLNVVDPYKLYALSASYSVPGIICYSIIFRLFYLWKSFINIKVKQFWLCIPYAFWVRVRARSRPLTLLPIFILLVPEALIYIIVPYFGILSHERCKPWWFLSGPDINVSWRPLRSITSHFGETTLYLPIW